MKKELYLTNDNELLYMIRSGDPMAYQLMLEKYENYIQALMEQFADDSKAEMRDDLNQECRILLMDLCERYRDDQECRFITFLVGGVRNRLKSIQKAEKRKRRRMKTVSLDSFVSEDGDPLIDIMNAGHMFYQPEFEWRYAHSVTQLNELLEKLTDKERLVWQLMNDDASYEEAAEVMGVTAKQFDNMRLRLKKKIVFAIMDDKDK